MIIVGAKGFAKEVLEILHQSKHDEEIFFFDNVSNDIGNLVFNSFSILKTFDQVKEVFKNKSKNFTLGIGDPEKRYMLYKLFGEMGGVFTSTISPFSSIGNFDNVIDQGCNIMTGTIITSSVRIEKGVLLNLNCTIGHDTKIGKFSEFSPGTSISGNCTIGEFCNFGTNSTLLPKITVGNNVVVGAGAVVTKDIPDNSLVIGIPGVIIKQLPPIVV